jgi:hypothetical protein
MPKTTGSFNPDEYTTVAERIDLFYRAYPNGQIHTRLVSYEGGRVIVEASVFRCETDLRPATTGLASERETDGEINAVACLENTETSAIGRALANLGFAGSARRPSREEMEKAERAREELRRSGGITEESPPRAVAALRQAKDHAKRVAEPSPSYGQLQQRANAQVAVAHLLERARRAGFSVERADFLARRLSAAAGKPSLLMPIAAELRQWLRAYSGGVARALEHPGMS